MVAETGLMDGMPSCQQKQKKYLQSPDIKKWPSHSNPGIYTKEIKSTHERVAHTTLFTAAWVTTANTWNRIRYPSTEGEENVAIYITGYY